MAKIKDFILIHRLALLVGIAMVLAGCVGLIPSPFRPSPGPTMPVTKRDLSEAFDIVCRNYRLGPDDAIRVLYQAKWNVPTGSFKLDALDQIKIKFILDPQLNEDVTIRPDGMITLQAIGEVQAAGLTPEQLARKIEDRFLKANIFSKEEAQGELKNYRLVTVHVVTFYEKVNKLVQSLTTLVGGSQTQVTVNPDGTIDLPLLKERVLAAGHTLPEVEATVNRLYRKTVLEHVVVSMALASAQSRRFYVLGQVAAPGSFQIRQPVTILHALSMAGGHLEHSADLTSVILVSRDVNGKPFGRRIDVKKMLDVGDMGQAILVKPYDVIYVPRTYIQDVRLFMDQYLGVVQGIAGLVSALAP